MLQTYTDSRGVLSYDSIIVSFNSYHIRKLFLLDNERIYIDYLKFYTDDHEPLLSGTISFDNMPVWLVENLKNVYGIYDITCADEDGEYIVL